jgi:hypothetical protein
MPNPEISQPCLRCGGDAFIVLEDLTFKVWEHGTSHTGGDPHFSLVTCTRCGRTEWFALDVNQVAQHPLASVVRLGDGGYRGPG